MGVYSEYLDRNLSFQDLTEERKTQLRRISDIRGGRDILVYAADLSPSQAPTSIDQSDLLPISDQLANLHGDAIDVVIQTTGGSGEVAEDIVRMLRDKYGSVAFIVAGYAKSAGTLVVMSGDEILMGPASALGPIDAQIISQGKAFSAEALLEGLEKIKREVEETGTLNKAYIPILQGLSPGELQGARNAYEFARVLVTDWLARYKFQTWETHSSTGAPVTEAEKRERAEQIATELSSHKKWLTHGRSIRIDDLRAMRLLITDYRDDPDLFDAIQRYHTLLQMTFATNIYKVIETPESQIFRMQAVPAQQTPRGAGKAVIEVPCPQCQTRHRVQGNIGQPQPLEEGSLPFPPDNRLTCSCGNVIDLSDARRQIEAQAGSPVIT